MKKDDSKQLTAADTALLQEYLTAIEELNQREPQQLPAEIWDKVWPEIQATGQVPAEYRDRIGVNDVTERKHHFEGDRLVYDDGEQVTKGYCDIVWERWNKERAQLDSKYHDAIIKALRVALTSGAEREEQQSILEMLQELVKQNRAELPAVIVRKLEKIDFPVDKVNKDIWRLLDAPTGGQLSMARYDVSKRGSKKPVDILYSLDFTKLENVSITRKLEPYDKRVYLAIAALYNDGYDVMSVQQIYSAMGYTGRMSATDIKKINTAISKMNGAHLYIDNLAEAKAYKYDRFKYDGVLLPMERIQAIVNGQTAEAAIHIFREPPMVSFARERKQITTVDIKLLDTPLSKTNANIEIEDYLIEQIAHIKKGKVRNKMLYDTIYKNAGVKTKKQRQRAPEKIRQLLDHYVKCGYIAAYKEVSDGVVIEY